MDFLKIQVTRKNTLNLVFKNGNGDWCLRMEMVTL